MCKLYINMKDEAFKENIAFGNIYEKKAIGYFDHDDFKMSEGKVSSHDIVFTKNNGIQQSVCS